MHMADEKKDQRVTLMMTQTELRRLDDWAFEKRIRSRGEAIRRLISAAILADSRVGKQPADSTKQDAVNPGGH